jgi:hypothetical protein
MVDEKLRKEMADAYADGDYRKALKLSRQLDKQILSNYTGKRKQKKKPKTKGKSFEI